MATTPASTYDQRVLDVIRSSLTGASLITQRGTAQSGQVIAVRTVKSGAGNAFLGNIGTLVGANVQLQVLSQSTTVARYQADYEDAASFNGTASGSGNTQRGGEYTGVTATETLFPGSAIHASYRTGGSLPRSVSQSYVPSAVVLDLLPYSTEDVIPGSVMFRWMGQVYQDFEGVIYRDRSAISAGIASGKMDYEGGKALMSDYVVGGAGPTDLQILSLWTAKGQWTTASLFFNTGVAPLRPGAGGFVLTVVDTKGTTLTAQVDGQGNVSGSHLAGRVEFARGTVELMFGDFVNDLDLTPAQKLQWWYSAADVGAVQPGKIWRPWPVNPTTLRYSCISFIYLPVDVALMGLDPAALPSNGEVAFARPGDIAVIGLTHGGSQFAPSVGMTYAVGHQRLSFVQVLGPDGAEIRTGYTADLDAGTLQFTDLANYPALVRVVARTEVARQIAEVRIDGKVRFTQPIGYEFPVGSVFSTALRQGDRFARISRVYNQRSWSGLTWADGLDLAIGESIGKLASAMVQVSNLGAITERWALRLRSDKITFDLIGQHLGQVATGTINQDFAPLHPAAGAPYMTIPAAAWSQGWIEGNTVFIDTVGAEGPVELVRCTQPGSPAGIDDSCWIEQRGDVDRPPSNA